MIDLLKFCDYDRKYHLTMAPLQVGEQAYATNGKLCIRVTDQRAAAIANDAQAKSLASVMAKYDPDADWRPLPPRSPSKPEPHDCPDCDECSNCDGTGRDECPTCGNDEECSECGGSGRASDDCETCHGSGKTMQSLWHDSPEMYLMLSLYDLMATLPGVQWAPSHNPKMIWLKFDEGEGACMLALRRTESAFPSGYIRVLPAELSGGGGDCPGDTGQSCDIPSNHGHFPAAAPPDRSQPFPAVRSKSRAHFRAQFEEGGAL